MGRHPQPLIRRRLLSAVTDYLLEHGLPAPSLRTVAEAAGTSPRMLIYHFETRDKLVLAALTEARHRQRSLFDDALTHRPGTPYASTLAAAWKTLAGPEGHRYNRLFSTVHAGFLMPAVPDFPVAAVHDWLPTLRNGFRADGCPEPEALATLALAVARGLIMDERSTGEAERTAAAYEAFITLLTAGARVSLPAFR